MTVVSNIVGGTTPTGATVVVRVDSSADVRVGVSATADGDLAWHGPVTPAEPVTGHFVAKVELTGLEAATHYWWVSEHDSVQDTLYPGELDTLPAEGAPASYTVAVIGDAGLTPDFPGSGTEVLPDRISNAVTFDTVRQHSTRPIMVCHLGDLHYYNPGQLSGGTLADFLQAWDDVLAQTRQHHLYRTMAFQYMWDDHDYGPNDSDRTFEGRANGAEAYRLRAPHHPLVQDSGSIYHAFTIGRVLYVSSDTRYERTPNAEPDSASKTYLGVAQKAWLRALLSTTEAEVMVWLNPNPWLGGHADTWSSFAIERDELAEMFEDTMVPASGGTRTWSESMVAVTADVHALGQWSASANPYGGFPGMLCASIDATPSAASGSQYDLGFRGGRDQYGTVTISDTGETITVTMTAWTGTAIWGAQEVVFDAPYEPDPDPDPGPDPDLPTAPPRFAEATIRDHVTWLGIHRTTGRIICELPDIDCDPSRQLSAYASSNVSIPLASGGPGWVPISQIEAATDGKTGAIVAIVNDLPLWMGLPVNRKRGSRGDLQVPSANTPEAYFLKRRVRDAVFEDEDRARVALALAQQAEALDGLGQGLGLEYDVTDTGDLVTIDYKSTSKTKTYDAIRALCVQGLEFEIALDWADNSQTQIVKILRIARRIGRVTGTPRAMFETGISGSVTEYELTESWAEGDYANHVVAIGPGQGDDQPTSTPAIDLDAIEAGVPIVEAVLSPGNDITDTDLLQGHADAGLERARDGTEALTITARIDGYPRLGVDAMLGDQASYRLNGPGHPGPTVGDPTDHALIGERRMTGWSANPKEGTWKPALVADPALEA